MYTWITEDDGYMVVASDGEYFCYTDTEEKADMLINLLNASAEMFESRGYDIGDRISTLVSGRGCI